MKKIIRISAYAAFLLLVAGTGCKKNYINPNAATSVQVFSSAKGLMGTAVGIQRTYVLNVAPGVTDAVGLLTNETFLINSGNGSELQLTQGGTFVDGTNALLGNIWATANKCIYDANNVINGAAQLSDKGYASGLIGYATIIKALSIGSLSMLWEKVPDTIGTSTTVFIDRVAGFNKAIAAIDKALAAIGANPVSTAFISDIPAGIFNSTGASSNDMVNVLTAIKARYLLFAGNYTGALAAANAVDLTKRATFNFDATTPNPVYSAATSTNNLYQPLDSTLGLPVGIAPDLADKRIPFYTAISATYPRFRLNGFWIANTSAIPIYFPGEMTLIKAECYARAATPDLTNAVTELNKVVTKTAGTDPLGIGAALPAVAPSTQADVLTQIYRNRCIELYLSGLKLEDMRRFGRPNSERKRNLLPYPFREKDSNPNIPPDPAF